MLSLLRFWIVIAASALVSGCSVHRLAERTRLPEHPTYDTRMTNQAAPGYVQTAVWRVRGATNTVYLVGTCHILADKEIPFPSSYYAAYRDSGELFVELDPLSCSGAWVVARAAPGAINFFFKHVSDFRCPEGKTLESYLNADTVRKLREHYGDSYGSKRGLTPLGLVFMGQFESGGAEQNPGVDDLFAALAHREFKPIRSLDAQAVSRLVVPTLDATLAHARHEIATRGADAVVQEGVLEDSAEREDWRYGNTAAALKEIEEMKIEVPQIYDQLLPDRNRRWMSAITNALHGERNVMVLVGALHMAGDEGLLELLRQQGFKPEQMYGVDRPRKVDQVRRQSSAELH